MELLLVAFAGGVLALDATSVGQFMVSRPLVAGALAGWILGEPGTGLLVGALLEAYLLVLVPSGGSHYPEGATATVVAVAAVTASEATGALPLGIAAGLVWGQVGGLTINVQRRLNGRIVPEPDAGDPGRVAAAHVLAIALDFLRGASVTLVGAWAGRWALPTFADSWPLGAGGTNGLLLMGGAVSAGILLRSLGGFRRRRILFAAGLALGLVGARVL